ncbi:NTP transferase domain-containing protein [Maribacter sp. 2307ULW6-5]|uniref:NTP transferase domain-containing protein n=1 Tax=Maribacter sp. 2307ULW6-5 TaxID=3386275 RepID=UPI0039BC2B2B
MLYGLVLAGGRSSRMGSDKGLLYYHGKPQREHLYQMLAPLCDRVYLSLRPDQVAAVPPHYRVVADTNEHGGPFNGLLSAQKKHPGASWLVLACDLPLMDRPALDRLLAKRERARVASAFSQEGSGRPEPLAAIWEAHGLEAARQFLEGGGPPSPQRFLLENQAHLVHPRRPQVLFNANSVQEYQQLLALLQKRRP